MSEDPRDPKIHAALELGPGEPLHGAVSSASGQRHPFVGWIEFALVLESLRQADEGARDDEQGV